MDTQYDQSATIGNAAAQLAGQQLNKMLGSPNGTSGTTSLLSNSAVANILSFATEYGAVRQSTSGTTTTLRANLAGIAGLAAGRPYLVRMSMVGSRGLYDCIQAGPGCFGISLAGRRSGPNGPDRDGDECEYGNGRSRKRLW